jgi:hypothetical protein
VENLINFSQEVWLQLVTQDAVPSYILGFLSVNCGALSVGQGEHFHQAISAMENRYKGKWGAAMLADCCWMVNRDALEIKYKQQTKRCLI